MPGISSHCSPAQTPPMAPHGPNRALEACKDLAPGAQTKECSLSQCFPVSRRNTQATLSTRCSLVSTGSPLKYLPQKRSMMDRTKNLTLHLVLGGLLTQHGARMARRECFSNAWIRHFLGGGRKDRNRVPDLERGDVIFFQSISPFPSIKI